MTLLGRIGAVSRTSASGCRSPVNWISPKGWAATVAMVSSSSTTPKDRPPSLVNLAIRTTLRLSIPRHRRRPAVPLGRSSDEGAGAVVERAVGGNRGAAGATEADLERLPGRDRHGLGLVDDGHVLALPLEH